MRAMPRTVLAGALPGVMLGQSDMLGGGPVSELASHPDSDGESAHHDFGLADEPHEYARLARVQGAAGHGRAARSG